MEIVIFGFSLALEDKETLIRSSNETHVLYDGTFLQ